MLNSESITKAQIPVGPTLVFCDIHEDEEVKLFCKNCNVLICSECVVDQHAGHTFISLKDKAGETRNNLPTVVVNLKSNTIPKVQVALKEIKRKVNEHSQNGTAVSKGINGQADDLILEINKVRNKLLQEEEKRQFADKKKLEKFENKMVEVLSNAERLIADFPHQMKTGNDSMIVKLEWDLYKVVPEMETQIEKIPSVERRIFVPGKRTAESIRHLLGQCMDKDRSLKEESIGVSVRISNHVTETKLEVYSTLHQEKDKGQVFAIATEEDQTAWFATLNGKTIKHVDTTGRVNKTVRFDTWIYGIAVMEDGCLLVIPNGSNQGRCWIKKVNPNGDIVTFVNMETFLSGICTTKTGHIYIGCTDAYSYEITDRSTRFVVQLSKTGIVQQRYQYDSKGQRLFTQPFKLQENINGDLWIIDRIARYEGRVLVIQPGRSMKFIYTGVRNHKLTQKFHPAGLTAAGDGTMLICDAKNDVIHVVDENGTLLRVLGSQHIVYPIAISLDRKNKLLWIGNESCVQVLHFK